MFLILDNSNFWIKGFECLLLAWTVSIAVKNRHLIEYIFNEGEQKICKLIKNVMTQNILKYIAD